MKTRVGIPRFLYPLGSLTPGSASSREAALECAGRLQLLPSARIIAPCYLSAARVSVGRERDQQEWSPSRSLDGRDRLPLHPNQVLNLGSPDAILGPCPIPRRKLPFASAICERRTRTSSPSTDSISRCDSASASAFLGPNGAGKTTTIEICEGLTTADSGEVEMLGMRWDSDAEQLRQRLGIQLQETQLSEKLTVFETVRLFRSFYRRGPKPAEVIALVQLEEKQKARVGSLSGGQKQRLALACALVGDPDFLFLDEPTTGLDPQARRQLWDLIEQFKLAGRTILLTTHYMDEAERLCDRVAIMDHGKVIALGTPRELIASIGVEHVVEFSAGSASKPLEVSALRRIEGVRDVPHGKWQRADAGDRTAPGRARAARRA